MKVSFSLPKSTTIITFLLKETKNLPVCSFKGTLGLGL